MGKGVPAIGGRMRGVHDHHPRHHPLWIVSGMTGNAAADGSGVGRFPAPPTMIMNPLIRRTPAGLWPVQPAAAHTATIHPPKLAHKVGRTALNRGVSRQGGRSWGSRPCRSSQCASCQTAVSCAGEPCEPRDVEGFGSGPPHMVLPQRQRSTPSNLSLYDVRGRINRGTCTGRPEPTAS